MTTPTDILNFWFDTPYDYNKWFFTSAHYDKLIRRKFRSILKQAQKGYCLNWLSTPESYTAFAILMNRFPKFLYRRTAKAYKYDRLCILFLEMGFDMHFHKLPMEYKVFVLLPYHNIENLEAQHFAIRELQNLMNVKNLSFQKKNFVRRALELHLNAKDIIVKFHRFPDRNPLFHRESSEEEIDYIDELDAERACSSPAFSVGSVDGPMGRSSFSFKYVR